MLSLQFTVEEDVTPMLFAVKVVQALADLYILRDGEGIAVGNWRFVNTAERVETELLDSKYESAVVVAKNIESGRTIPLSEWLQHYVHGRIR